ncbi:MAG: hypothetical protein LAN84_08460 [Acidobacteriia bacterium]|nr:hypothetical protein [Terriglobia bacterium]
MVTRELAGELARVLQRFAREAGFGDGDPVGIFFRPGVVGHHQLGRAADIYAVGGIGIEEWKRRWDAALGKAPHPAACRSRARHEGMANLGWRLYKALQLYGRWAQPYGYPIQLFGPWTRREGPWKFISDGLLDAHRDHIHVAK